MSESPDTRQGMQSVLRSLDVLEAVAQNQPVGISALARMLGIPKATVHRILRTLGEAGWLAPQGAPGEQRWILTARALAVGARVMTQDDVRERARPMLEELGRQTDENIHLSVPDGDSLILIDKVPSSRPVQTVAQVGERAPMVLTASGWAYLSRLPVPELLARIPPVVDLATGTRLARTDLLAELETVAHNEASPSIRAGGDWTSPPSAPPSTTARADPWPPCRSPCPATDSPTTCTNPTDSW